MDAIAAWFAPQADPPAGAPWPQRRRIVVVSRFTRETLETAMSVPVGTIALVATGVGPRDRLAGGYSRCRTP